jgi:hypothetical protein
MRICVIGDSHVACLKTGWDENSQKIPAGMTVDYFGAQSSMLRALDVRGSALVPVSDQLRNRLHAISGGKTEIETRHYDVFVIVGLGLNLRRLMVPLLGHYRTISYKLDGRQKYYISDAYMIRSAAGLSKSFLRLRLNLRRLVVPLLGPYRTIFSKLRGSQKHYVSDACMLRSAAGLLSQSLAIDTVDKIKAAGASNILLVPQPVPSEQILDRRDKGAMFRKFLKSGDGPAVYKLFREALAEIARANQVSFVEQPEETRRDGFLTQQRYSVGSVRLTQDYDSPHREQDFGHMNDKYGALVWERVIGMITRSDEAA